MDPYRPRDHPSIPQTHLRSVQPGDPRSPFVDEWFSDDEAPRYDRLGRGASPPGGIYGGLIPFVGGYDELGRLDAEPIPDEPFDWSAVQEPDRAMVTRVLELSDRCCDELLDVEFRTIARRVLARVVARDPKLLRRSKHDERIAAGLVWLVGRASGEFGRRGRKTVGRLWEWFGVSSCADRGRSAQHAAGLLPDGTDAYTSSDDEIPLGDAALLHSTFRARLLSRRNAFSKIEEGRRPWSLRPDGRTADVRAPWLTVGGAGKGILAGSQRTVVTVWFGDDLDDARFFALSVPEAHKLIRVVQHALADPPPRLGADQ